MICVPTAAAQWVTPPVDAERVEYRLFESAAAGTTVSYHIYTPPQYDAYPDRCFPVLYWLHGSTAQTTSITPISAWFHREITEGRIPPMIVVMPNGMSFRMWCDSKSGLFPMETVVIEDLLPEIESNFRTVEDRAGRMIEGFSMGGQGAARLGLRRPDLFAAVSLFGAGAIQTNFLDAPTGGGIPPDLRPLIYQSVWGSDPNYYTQQHPRTVASENAAAIIASAQRIRQVVGELDFVLDMNAVFHENLVQVGIPHDFRVLPGVGHNTFDLFSALADDYAPFYRDQFARFDPAAIDLTADGAINFFDLLAYLDRYAAQIPAADLTKDGIINFFDAAEYLARFNAGCP
jgi:enterochelin esterase-like enzyme